MQDAFGAHKLLRQPSAQANNTILRRAFVSATRESDKKMDENKAVENIPISVALKWYFCRGVGNFLTIPLFIWLAYCLVMSTIGGVIQWLALVRAISAVFGIIITILTSFLWILPFLPAILYYSLLRNLPGGWMRRDATKKLKIIGSIGIIIGFSLFAFLIFHLNVKLIAWVADRNPEAAYKAGVIGSKVPE